MSIDTPIRQDRKIKSRTVVDSTNSIQSNSVGDLNLLFWNVKHKDLSSIVESIANHHKADFILLAELSQKHIQKYKDALGKRGYVFRATPSSKVKIFDRLTNIQGSLEQVSSYYSQDDRLTSIIYNLNGESVLIVGVHLFSIASMKFSESRKGFAQLALKVIEEIEKQHKIDKTIIIGDFNLNPHESGMIDYFGFNATLCKNTAQLEHREIAGEKRRYFFNPSWQAYSNVGIKDAPAGTFYYSETYDTTLLYWNLLDQAIIRPKLVPNSRGFKIITDGGERVPTLLNSELKPDVEKYSDHLPILYSIKI
ncbi:endonuclease/exonuclease/phosphatase family protein [Bacillus albus]|uniref:endonuclease/exonuclease/phosphatase family protein n=1 Tax=Bacillus albus TaxID=2026189 RepID=UPI001009EDE7|nr:endonuclease/exonuclease/phosphatase family protein [Bacillus albus]RXJ13402.1 endonuclease/exonuclease/phosphatase family protein [Bacillus albus]RXJ22777.1 endonuclease/exonuclease/phosphatase family protein [Bacillus albus]RXJ24952.1 endonuclease/exonuclease/phosphatase family protein [Bacillus albus]RXJ36359.1 endonuclease/exonuclease/phosphatase family protein [Bacillus albus]RXJ52071.1 endonuclease/exonuclease/phosphatase family protein [Bacillus albus]